jgi:hypothetical protein
MGKFTLLSACELLHWLGLLSAVVFLSACPKWDPANNPVSPEYPCGTRAHVCTTSPLACCWQGQDCGAEGTSCPAGMCCASGDSFGVERDAGGPTKQWVP